MSQPTFNPYHKPSKGDPGAASVCKKIVKDLARQKIRLIAWDKPCIQRRECEYYVDVTVIVDGVVYELYIRAEKKGKEVK